MRKEINGNIVLIDYEKEEVEYFRHALEALNYTNVKMKDFRSSKKALDYLVQTKDCIFMIIANIDMPDMPGLELKTAIERNEETMLKAIPFIFTCATATQKDIEEAYRHSIQGFFEKPADLNQLIELLSVVMQYWFYNLTPSQRVQFKEPVTY
jgi:response regulator RpfG family c-di-GMP phosphodiesterase